MREVDCRDLILVGDEAHWYIGKLVMSEYYTGPHKLKQLRSWIKRIYLIAYEEVRPLFITHTIIAAEMFDVCRNKGDFIVIDSKLKCLFEFCKG